MRFQVITGSSKLTMERLQARTVDAAIVTTPPAASDDLWMTPLWCDALVVVAPAYHPLIGRACMLTDLAQQPMVVMHPDSGLRQLVHDTFARMGVADPVLPLMETDSLEAMSRFVQAGMGLAIVPWCGCGRRTRREAVHGRVDRCRSRCPHSHARRAPTDDDAASGTGVCHLARGAVGGTSLRFAVRWGVGDGRCAYSWSKTSPD
ncbi:LysR family transcriptional regulator substrate-binding protein [Alicyclobacillus sacchari]|uniref:LysR family transcriptional regulator substrate-binding protein n=1 Tax=Alicyclobacillus sacchari TaxID=392010 RepID=UPI003D6776C3